MTKKSSRAIPTAHPSSIPSDKVKSVISHGDDKEQGDEELVAVIQHPPAPENPHPSVGHVAWSPNGRFIATSGSAPNVRLWNSVDWSITGEFEHRLAQQLFFSHNGSILFSFSSPLSHDEIIRAWDVVSHKLLWASGRLDGSPCAVDPSGRYISVRDRAKIFFLDARTGRIVPGKEIYIGEIANNSFSSNGSLLFAAVHAQARLLVIEVESCKILDDVVFVKEALPFSTPLTPEEEERQEFIREYVGAWSNPAISLASDQVALHNENNTTYILSRTNTSIKDVRSEAWRLIHRIPGRVRGERKMGSGEIQGIAWSPDGTIIARAHGDMGFVSIIDTHSWQVVKVFDGHRMPPDGTASYRHHGRHVSANDVAFSPDGRWLASVGSDNVARIWRVPSLLAYGNAVPQKIQ